jgi:translation initiation factor IF-2
MGKKRIHELAKDLALTSSELLQHMADLSILPGAKLGASHSVDDSVAEEIKVKVSKILEATRVKPVVRRRKKSGFESDRSQTDKVQKPDWASKKPSTQAELKTDQVDEAIPQAVEEPEAPKVEEVKTSEPKPKPFKFPAGKYDKATIVGVHHIDKPTDSRGNLTVPAIATEKNQLPDFLKLSPTKSNLEPQTATTITAVSLGDDAPIAPTKPLDENADATAPASSAPKITEFKTSLGAPDPKGEKGEQSPIASKPQRPDRQSDGKAGGESGRGYDQHPKRRGDKNVGSRITRDLSPTRQLVQIGPKLSGEPAKVVGMVKSWTSDQYKGGQSQEQGQSRGGRFPGKPTGSGGGSGAPRTSAQPRQATPSGRPTGGVAQTEAAPTRKRGDRKKKAGHSQRTTEDTRNTRRRELVERTDLYSEGTWERTRTKKPKSSKKTQSKTEITVPKAIKRRIKVDEVITVSELAHRLSLKAGDIIKKLMGLGVMAGLNQSLDFDTATLVAAEFGYDVEKSAFDEGDFLPLPDVGDKYPLSSRPPVVTIMGHVDHGKTSLLDYIRKTKIQECEAGGITQHIGAYHVQVGQRYITFLDTPGHEAFTAMRSRGAQVTDIVILIVAADDGVMPQTKEAADHAKAAKVPIIVAVNKIDKQGADPERIRRQMMELGLTQEAWGGDTVFVDISAKTGQGVDDLLEMILLQADLLELKSRTEGPARGRIIDARLDKGRGAMATVLVGEGSLKQGDTYVCGVFFGKIRAMFDDHGQKVDKAGPAIPVEIQGISGIPLAGDEFIVMEDEKQAKQVSQHRLLKQRESVLVKTSKLTLENLFDHIKAGAIKGLNLIIKADVQGSLEAILDAVSKFSTPEIKITVIHSAIGVVTETDIMLASASNALIICFGIKPPAIKVQEVAESEQVQIRYYDVIYKLLEDIKEAMAGLLDPIKNVKIIGQIEVRAVFNITKVGQVAGCYVTDGKVARGSRIKLIRDKEIVYDGRVSSLKREKNDVREVLAGYECGISLEGHSDIQQGDHLEVYQVEETAATVDQINAAVERAAAEAANKIQAAEAEAEAAK